MLKLYYISGQTKQYWETWDAGAGEHCIHWGALGTRGEQKTVRSTQSRNAESIIQEEIDDKVSLGFRPIEHEHHAILMIEYAVEGFGSGGDLGKRHRLEDRMNETLGWTGLGACDGGSGGGDTMEVCNFVVDFDIAKQVIAADLAGTEFANYSRIYNEKAE